MPKQKKTAAKRRKCQRSRSQRRRNNNRQNRTIRVGGLSFRKLSEKFSEWNATRRINAEAAEARRDPTRHTTFQRATLRSPLRMWKQRNTNVVAPAPLSLVPFSPPVLPFQSSNRVPTNPIFSVPTPAPAPPAVATYNSAPAAAAAAAHAVTHNNSDIALARKWLLELPPVPRYKELPPAGTKICKSETYTILSESQKFSLHVIVANGVKGLESLESPHITWAAIQLLNSPRETALPPDVFNKMVDVIFIGNELHETIPGQGPVKIDRLDGRFKLISMMKGRDPDPSIIIRLNIIIDEHIANINKYDPRANANNDAKLSLFDLFSIFMTLRREIFCASLLWTEMNTFKFEVDTESPIAVRCSKVTFIKLIPILTMYDKICKGRLDRNRLFGTITEALSFKKIDTLSLLTPDISDIYEETGNRVLDMLLKYGQIMNRIV